MKFSSGYLSFICNDVVVLVLEDGKCALGRYDREVNELRMNGMEQTDFFRHPECSELLKREYEEG